MAQFIIKGGKLLSGEFVVRGAKNHAVAVFPASLLFRGSVTIHNVPLVEDISRSGELLSDLGYGVRKSGERTFVLTPRPLSSHELKRDVAERFRASILFAGPVLARLGKVSFSYPGGCVIGRRPIDLFLDFWKAMGARVHVGAKGVTLTAARLHGIDYTFRKSSHTGTESLIMTAVLARGRTTIHNAAMEPEVAALCEFLARAGVTIRGIGTPTLEIEGTNGKLLTSATTSIISDRIEAGSIAILAGLVGRAVRITHCVPEHFRVLIEYLRFTGVSIEEGKDWIAVSRAKRIAPVDIVKTREYPGFATDHQAPFTVFLTQAQGQSMIFETVFDGRLSYIEDLNRMGASITICDPHRAIIFGPAKLRGRTMESPDLRAGVAFVIAALTAKGTSRIGNVYQIDRGYESLVERLQKIGADIQRVS